MMIEKLREFCSILMHLHEIHCLLNPKLVNNPKLVIVEFQGKKFIIK